MTKLVKSNIEKAGKVSDANRKRSKHIRSPSKKALRTIAPELNEDHTVVCTGIKKNIDTNLASYMLSFTTHDGTISQDIAGSTFVSPNKLFSTLAGFGYNGDPQEVTDLAKEGARRKYRVFKVSSKGGWIGSQLITRFGAFGAKDPQATCRFDTENEQFTKARRRGTEDEFLDGAGELMTVSPEMCLAYLAGLAAPVGALIGKSSFSICFSSESTTGKTSVIAFAQSLASYAFNDDDLINFGDTLGSLLDDLDVFGGVVTGFTDIKNAVEKDRDLINKLQTLTFSSSSGHKRRRLGNRQERSTSVGKKRKTFNLFLLSAELPLSELFRKAGARREGGDMARLIEVPIANRVQGGIFSCVAASEREAFFQRFDDLRKSQYGTVLPIWCKHLASKGRVSISKKVASGERAFFLRVGELEALQGRIGKHFAFLDALVKIADCAGLLPIPAEEMHGALDVMFDRIAKLKRAKQVEHLQYQIARLQEFSGKFYPLTEFGKSPAKLVKAKICFRRKEDLGGKSITVINLHRDSFLENADESSHQMAEGFIKLIKNEMRLLEKGSANPVKQEGLDRRRYIRFTVGSAKSLQKKLEATLKRIR